MSTQRPDDHLPRERDALHDDPLLPQTPLQQAPPPTRGCASLFRIVDLILSSSASIVVGQLFFSAAAWAFVGYLVYHKQLPLGDFAVDIISQHHSETTLLVTLIATAISALSTFLFTKAVGRALTTRLCRPLSVGDLRTGIELSKGSFVLNWEWCSMATILCVVILNTLTAAWATILTPSFIVVDVYVAGRELDLSTLRTPAFNGSLEPQPYPGPNETSPLRWTFGPDVTRAIDDTPALSWGASAGIGAPSMQTLPLPASPVFNVSTGGIFPAALTNWTYFMTNATASVVGVGSNASYPRGLLSNYTILQQGFTVDVACQTQDFSDIGPGFPSMTLFNASLPLPPLGQTQSNFSTPLVAWAWTTNCTAYSSSYVGSILVSNASGTQVIAGAVCPFQDFVGPSNQSALVLWQDVDRSYQDVSLVCEVTPFITTVRVQYSGTVVNVSDVVTKTRLSADGTNWPLLSVPAQTLATILYLSQGMYDNSLMSNIQFTESELGQTNLNVTAALGNYFRGMVEYWGTMHRTLLYFTQEDIPDEMMIPMNGTMVITTMGWKYNASTHSFALVPISIVMALTMCAVAMTYWEKRKVRRSLEFPQSFNPSNPLHIILASRRGALYQAPSGHDRTEDESLQVHLEVRDGMAVLTSEGPGDVDEGKGPSGPLGDFSVAENVQTTPSKV